jgi:GT2 family glycosyltransferase
MEPCVCIIIVNYNNLGDTLECLESLGKVDYSNKKIILVDNNSSEKITLEHIKPNSGVTLVSNDSNLGFTGGNNIGMEIARRFDPKYFLLLNNDTTVRKDFLRNLVNAMENDPDIDIAGAVNCYFSEPGTIWQTGGRLRIFRGSLEMLFCRQKIESLPPEHIWCDYVPGSSLMARAEMVNEAGPLNDDFFFQCEDLDWGLKTRKRNKKVVCVPGSVIFHKVSGSTPSFISLYFYHRNMLKILRDNSPLPLVSCTSFILYSVLKSGKLFLEGKPGHAFSILNSVKDFFAGNFGRGSMDILLTKYNSVK